MKTKRIIAIISVALIALGLCACKGSSGSATTTAAQTTAAQTTAAQTTAAQTTAAQTTAAQTTAAATTQAQTTQAETTQAPQGGDYSSYVGMFGGTDPWGGQIYVTINSAEGNVIQWNFNDVLSSTCSAYYENPATELDDSGMADFAVSGEADSNEASYHFEYTGKIQLADGNVFLTFESGDLKAKAADGTLGGASHQVGPLTAEQRTVKLTKY